MTLKEEEFLKRLIDTFKIEAHEHIKSISTGLLELEKTLSDTERSAVIETVYRGVHSLKGAARSVNFMDIESVCQSLEDIFASLKRGKLEPTPVLFDILHDAVDLIDESVTFPERSLTERVSELLLQLTGLESGKVADGSTKKGDPNSARKKEATFLKDTPANIENAFLPGGGSIEEETSGLIELTDMKSPPLVRNPAMGDTVRITTSRLDSLLLQAEEMLSIKLTAAQRSADIRDVKFMITAWNKEWENLAPSLRSVRQCFEKQWYPGMSELPWNQVLDFIDCTHGFMEKFRNGIDRLLRAVRDDQRNIGTMVDNLLKDMKNVLMLPFGTLLEIFPKLVRDLSRDRGKEAELVIQGEDIEIDKRILEIMKDPLIHLIRNAIDHGIEFPEERKRKGKPLRGRILIAVSQIDGSKVDIRISDDGRGIVQEEVKATVLKQGLVSEEEAAALTEQEILALIFQSEISTSPLITDISGRGLGLAIVREKIEEVGGLIVVETKPDHFTTFNLSLPLSLSNFRGILIRLNDYTYVIPTTYVERAMRLGPDDIKTVENRETIALEGKLISLVRLGEILELPAKEKNRADSKVTWVLVLRTLDKRIAFSVDEILYEQEVLIKSFGKQLTRVRNIAGATILGSGRVAPVLNVPDLMKSAIRGAGRVLPDSYQVERDDEALRQSILVVEDSITSRMLIKNILESAGYFVKTAVDGSDAWTKLKTEEFDLVVSDVEMPRMNGFELTVKVREDKKLAEIPLILVTALESREDRERGIDVGANAYIVKSSFDQSNLLEVVRRLI